MSGLMKSLAIYNQITKFCKIIKLKLQWGKQHFVIFMLKNMHRKIDYQNVRQFFFPVDEEYWIKN